MNEFKLIAKHIKKTKFSDLAFGIGDDCSVLKFNKNTLQIESTDSLVEDVHFRRQDLSFFELGYKSLAVNLSDIAAMGGIPKTAHLSLAIDKKTTELNIKDFLKGFYHLAEQENIHLIGGDMSSSPHGIFINVHISGRVSSTQIQYRHNFKKADFLCVSGFLGDSAAGLDALLKNRKKDKISRPLILSHIKPPIELEKAQWLARQKGVSGMMDLSDGLISDLKRIPMASFNIETTHLPIGRALKKYCETYSLDPLAFALAGGEDYRILFGCKKERLKQIQKDFENKFKTPFFVIGSIKKQKTQKIQYFKNKKPLKINFKGFDHFS